MDNGMIPHMIEHTVPQFAHFSIPDNPYFHIKILLKYVSAGVNV
jgi:hypothetical protein